MPRISEADMRVVADAMIEVANRFISKAQKAKDLGQLGEAANWTAFELLDLSPVNLSEQKNLPDISAGGGSIVSEVKHQQCRFTLRRFKEYVLKLAYAPVEATRRILSITTEMKESLTPEDWALGSAFAATYGVEITVYRFIRTASDFVQAVYQLLKQLRSFHMQVQPKPLLGMIRRFRVGFVKLVLKVRGLCHASARGVYLRIVSATENRLGDRYAPYQRSCFSTLDQT